MHWTAAVLAALAVVAFVAAYLNVQRRWARVELGLVFLTLAWAAQLILLTGSRLTLD